MAGHEEPEESAFASHNRESFPPTFEDNKDVRNFSDEHKWPVNKLLGRLALYTNFVQKPNIMQRARDTSFRILEHLLFELPYRGIILDIGIDDDDETEPIDINALRDMLGDD